MKALTLLLAIVLLSSCAKDTYKMNSQDYNAKLQKDHKWTEKSWVIKDTTPKKKKDANAKKRQINSDNVNTFMGIDIYALLMQQADIPAFRSRYNRKVY